MNICKPIKRRNSILADFFKSFIGKTQTSEPEVAEPIPPVTGERLSNDNGKLQKEFPLPPAKNKAPTPPVTKKKTKKKSRTKFDKKGFRIFKDNENLSHLFQLDNEKEPEEDFAQLFEKSQTDPYQQQMLKEKINTSNHTKRLPLTIGDRIKSFPDPQEELDLHGYTTIEAESRTESFIRNTRFRRIRTIRVIVGKGLHSNGKAVLPDVVETKIIQLKQSRLVLSYKWEKKDKRKSGSLIVYLT